MVAPNYPNDPENYPIGNPFSVGNKQFYWDGEKWRALSNADASLRSQLAATDSDVLVGGVEAGKVAKRVSNTVSAAEFGLSHLASAAINLQALKDAIAATPVGGYLLIPDTGGVCSVDTTGGLSAAVNVNKRITLVVDGTLQANFSAIQANPPTIFNVTADDVVMIGKGKFVGDGAVDQTNTGDHTDTPSLVYVSGDNFKSNVSVEKPPKTGYSFVGSLNSEVANASLIGGAVSYSDTAYFSIRGFQSHGLKIKDNRVEQDGSGGKYCTVAFLVDCDDVQYKDNTDSNALFEKHVYLFGDNATITGNKTTSATITAPFRTHGFNNKITDNSTDGCAGGIQSYGSITTDNNTFLNCTQGGISVFGDPTYDCSNTSIGKDTVTGSGANVENLIRVFTDGADANNVKILGATADSATGIATFRPVALEASLGNQITNARVTDVTTNGGQYSILLTRVNGGKMQNNKGSNTTSSPWAETSCSDIEWIDNSARNCALNEIQGLSGTSRGSGNTYSDAGLSGVITMVAATSTSLGRTDIAPNARVFITPANDAGGVQQVVTGLKTQVAAGDIILSTCNGGAATAGAQLHYFVEQ